MSNAKRILVSLGRKRYIVVKDEIGVIRIEYVNAVVGKKNLDLKGKTAKRVLNKCFGAA